MYTFNAISAQTVRQNGIRNGDGKLLPCPGQVRSGNGEENDSTKSKFYAANIARNSAKI